MVSGTGTTITQFFIQRQRELPEATGELTAVLNDVVVACKAIGHALSQGGLAGVLGGAGTNNVQGEGQKKLDVLANDLFLQANEWAGHVAGLASEEMADVVPLQARARGGKYLLLFDPLDGSSNIDINVSVGTIFSVLRCPDGVAVAKAEDFLQPGVEQVCAGYVIYGPSTMLVLTTGDGVHGFTLSPSVGEFLLTHPDMRIPEETAEFAINASNSRFWEPPMQRYIDECLAGADGPRQKNFNMRWVASMVADVHRVLCRGGLFTYPRDSRNPSRPGKLRLLYEVNPMSFIVEQAGGLSSTGDERCLEIVPTELHQRVPVMLGSKSEVQRLVEYHQAWVEESA